MEQFWVNNEKYKFKCIYHGISVWKFLGYIFIVFYILVPNNNILAAPKNSKCITEYKDKLLKGGWDYGFFCEHGSKFLKISIKNKKYIIYNYVYRYMPADGNVMHGGQRLVFFNLDYKYIGQFFLDAPQHENVNSMKIFPAKNNNKLILNDGENVGEILLSSPPKGVLYNQNINFFK